MKLSLIVPLYNEEENLENNIKLFYDYFKKQDFNFEIILINDGSKDKTGTIAAKLESNLPEIRLYSYEKNKGKAYGSRIHMHAFRKLSFRCPRT